MMNAVDRVDELKGVLKLLREYGEWPQFEYPILDRIKELEAELPEPNLYERDELGRRPIDIHEAEARIDDRHREEL